MALIVLALIVAGLGLGSFFLSRWLYRTPMSPAQLMRGVWVGGVLDGIAICCIGALVYTLVTRS